MSPNRQPVRRRDEAAEVARFADEIRQLADGLTDSSIDRGEAKLLARAMRELSDSFQRLAPYRGRRKVTVFGSARTPENTPIYRLAVAFGKALAEAGFMVITGAGPGIMEACHVGAGPENSIGLNIELPFEQRANPVIEGDPKLLSYNYFFTRKLMFLKEAEALVLFPGGFGTHDEGFEVLTMLQTGKASSMPVVLVDVPGGEYWEKWLEYIHAHLFKTGMISDEDFHLFRIVHSVEDAMEEILGFYRVYHSQRYVGNQLVLRLQKPLKDETFNRLSNEFKDLLVGGEFRRGDAHPHEANEPETADLPRLYIRFNRRSHGRLREMIDLINRES